MQSDTAVDRYLTRASRTPGSASGRSSATDDGAFLGFTGLNPMPEGAPGEGDLEIGWRLARHAWHQGYATEAALAAVDAAFGPLRLPRLWSITAVTNTPSQAVMRRIGMREHGHFDRPASRAATCCGRTSSTGWTRRSAPLRQRATCCHSFQVSRRDS